MSWELLAAVAVAAALALFWHSSLAARELANRIAADN